MSDPSPDRFTRALRGVLRPLVRLLISRGVTAPRFYRLLKSVYVDVAQASFRIDGKPPTDSRITLLTGVHRRDVRAILSAGPDGWEVARARSAALATVVSRWREIGTPLSRAQFDDLVEGFSRDIRPRTVLDELLRQGLVERRDDLLHLSPEAVVGPRSDDDRLAFFATNLGDHLAAASQNLEAETPPFLERAVFYNHLTPDAVDRLERHARVELQSLLEDLDARSRQEQRDGAGDPAATERYRLGVYFFREPKADDEET
ncbi:DUF6502 family protein [Jannaschia aquimarina]|uniref:Uncharacterized protein n=1 Tax=Jannaschia aquimarina TaxID=935700 RepID=A0A0D1D4J6_9RHOB|nr:DUF6502 family protein [Jannaschia aquimarina]KIT14993.1 hypothetical protein jaqu_33180 [Jannaschia aquimarina]SNS61439.1 hypothetical protein SAMN05421775_101643 [Jannaschia aquimarina]